VLYGTSDGVLHQSLPTLLDADRVWADELRGWRSLVKAGWEMDCTDEALEADRRWAEELNGWKFSVGVMGTGVSATDNRQRGTDTATTTAQAVGSSNTSLTSTNATETTNQGREARVSPAQMGGTSEAEESGPPLGG
jgi:hypothetical protein